MKKSVILILGIVFFLSVLVVGFFGMQAFSYNVKVYVNKLVPGDIYMMDGTDEVKVEIYAYETNDHSYYIRENYVPGLTFTLSYITEPLDASNRKIQFSIIESSSDDVATIVEDSLTKRNTLVFNKRGQVLIDFRTTDGSNIAMQIRFTAK